MGIYDNKEDEKLVKEVKDWIKETKEERLIICGDFNARTGIEGTAEWKGKEND